MVVRAGDKEFGFLLSYCKTPDFKNYRNENHSLKIAGDLGSFLSGTMS